MSTALKSCGHCGGAILTGVTGYGGQICMCPRPWTTEQKENLQTALQIIADRERLQIAEDVLRRYPEGWLEYRNRTIPANAAILRARSDPQQCLVNGKANYEEEN